MGNNRTPVRRGGGHTFAKSARDFGKRMPKRMRRLACRNAILVKILSNDAIIFDNLNIDQAKTKELRAALHSVGATRGCVLALDSQNPAMVKSGRNIPKTDVRQVGDLNAYDILRRNKLIFTKPAFESFARKVQIEGGD
jgi:large subunit ribosomal protein L4